MQIFWSLKQRYTVCVHVNMLKYYDLIELKCIYPSWGNCNVLCNVSFFAPSSLYSATTRKLYEKKLQKLLDQPPAEPEAPTDVTALPKADSNQNGNTNSDQYSDKEDGELWLHITHELFKVHIFF